MKTSYIHRLSQNKRLRSSLPRSHLLPSPPLQSRSHPLAMSTSFLSSFSSPFSLYQNLKNHENPKGRSERPQLYFHSSLETERGVEFDTGGSFFRHESSIARDLGVLAATVHGRSLTTPTLHILDAMCGCGVRSLRYLSQSNADFVWANDANEANRGMITSNLERSGERVGLSGNRRWVVTHLDARRLLAERFLAREYFDLIDVDSFGGDSSFLRAAIEGVRIGGMVYVTSTDGYSSGGHRPQHSLASYGAYIRPMPYSNEIGLRMLIGGVLREAAVLGFHISPLFSYYSYHGPVFRVMLRVTRGTFEENGNYGFIGYCHRCGNSQSFSWDKLGQIFCHTCSEEVPRSLCVSGPLWTGPLHDGIYLHEMLNLAEDWGWTHSGKDGIALQKLLKQMTDESDPELPFGYIKLDEIASRAKINSPPVSTIINTLKQESYAASRSHIASNAIKTNCPMEKCIEIVRKLRQGLIVM